MFLPFMHSEELTDQIYCGKLIDVYCEKSYKLQRGKKILSNAL